MTRTTDPRSTGVTGDSGPADTPQARAMQQVALAHNLCDQGRAAEAEDLCRWVLTQAPTLASAQVALGRSRFEQGHLQEARAILEAAADRHPAFFSAQRWLAEVLVRAGDWPRASEILVKAEALSPGQPRIGELVRHVMGGVPAPPPRTDPASIPAGPPDSGPTSFQRRRTYLGPAVADVPELGPRPVPASAVGPPPIGPTSTVPLPPRPLPANQNPIMASGPPPSMPRSERSSSGAASGRARSGASGPVSAPSQTFLTGPSSVPNRSTPAHGNTPTRRQTYPEAPALAGLRPGMLPALGRARAAVQDWARHHPRVALLMAAIVLFTGAALTVVMLASGGPHTIATLPAEDEVPGAALPPMGAADFDELAKIVTQDRRLRASKPTASVSRSLLAEALLASEYGRPAALESEIWADELAEGAPAGEVPEDLNAARVLFRVARGARSAGVPIAKASRLDQAPSALARFTWARLLMRGGDSRGAMAHLAEAGDADFLPARLLLAELRLDAGETAAAVPLIRGVLDKAPGHPLAVQRLIEATNCLGKTLDPADNQLVERSCAGAGPRAPTLATMCRLHRGLVARRAGQREEAQRHALLAAEIAPTEPRVLSAVAQLLINTGATLEALTMIKKADGLADRRLPPLAWARTGAGLATDRRVPVPSGSPPGPEARLIAARASFVGPRPAGAALAPPSPSATGDDRDLRWMADAARVRGRRAAQEMAAKFRSRYGHEPPGPVAAFIAGTLARRAGDKSLARVWLARSMEGHGDACRAASLYRISLQEEGINPKLNSQLQRAIGRLGCDRLEPGTPAR